MTDELGGKTIRAWEIIAEPEDWTSGDVLVLAFSDGAFATVRSLGGPAEVSSLVVEEGWPDDLERRLRESYHRRGYGDGTMETAERLENLRLLLALRPADAV